MADHPFPRAGLAACLLLPLVALALLWGATLRMAQQGQEWLIPVHGYDPQDLLRGHFVQYRYDWPVDGNDVSYADHLCLEGVAPHILRASSVTADQTAGCAIVVRATLGARPEVRGLESGILYVSQSRAISLARDLADPKLKAFIRVRIRPDGVIRPLDLQFQRR